MELLLPFPLLAAIVVVAVSVFVGKIVHRNFIRPLHLLRLLRAQGIPGYPFRPFLGQIPEMAQIEQLRQSNPSLAASTRATEFLMRGTQKFGKFWSWSLGHRPRVVVVDPAVVRQVFIAKVDTFGKPSIAKTVRILGEGLVTSEGDTWVHHRRIINPAFHLQELRRLYLTMAQCAREAVDEWRAAVLANPKQPLAMDVELSKLTLKIIVAAAFGKNLHNGQERRLRDAFDDYVLSTSKARLALAFPVLKLLPTANNRVMSRSESDIRRTMREIITDRVAETRTRKLRESVPEGSQEKERVDLLELMLSATAGMGLSDQKGQQSSKDTACAMTEQQLMDQCLTFLFAGHETTAVLLTWTVMLLSVHMEWQTKAREEVLQLKAASAETGDNWIPDFDQLGQLKTVGCILYETLRLFPPASNLTRTCNADTKLTDALTVPAGCDVTVPIEVLHVTKEFWGADALDFNPERFAQGIANAASHPGAYLPFGLGPRVCIGQNFAMHEAKLILSLILCNFTWQTAEQYTHYPVSILTTKPKYGMPILFSPFAG